MEQLEATIAEFAANSVNMDKIAQYARACWTPDKKGETPAQLKKYSVDALVNVAYFVQKIATELDAVLATQSHDLERLGLATSGLASRLSAAHRLAGEATLDAMRQPRAYDHHGRAECPATAPRSDQAGRSPIDFRALDGVGTPLVAGQGPNNAVLAAWVDYGGGGGGAVSNSSPSPAAPAPASSAPLFPSSGRPAALAAPASLAPPPLSSLPPPPSLSSLAPPPPLSSFSAPPPPALDDWDLPPPPPPPPLAASPAFFPPPPPPPAF